MATIGCLATITDALGARTCDTSIVVQSPRKIVDVKRVESNMISKITISVVVSLI